MIFRLLLLSTISNTYYYLSLVLYIILYYTHSITGAHLSWQTGWCPAGLRTCCAAAGEHPVRPTAPSPKTRVGCKTTESHQDRLIPSRHPYPVPCRRGPAWTWRRSGAPRPAASPARSSGPRTAPCWAPGSPGCRSRCTWAAGASRCSSADGGCCCRRPRPEGSFSPRGLNFPTARSPASPSWWWWCCWTWPVFCVMSASLRLVPSAWSSH